MDAAVHGNLGSAYLELGQCDKAFECYTVYLMICRNIGDRQGEKRCMNGLRHAYFKQAFRKQLITRGNGLVAQGDTEGAIHEFASLHRMTQAVILTNSEHQLAFKINNSALGSLGAAHCTLRQFGKAIGYSTTALTISRGIGDRQGGANTLDSLDNSH